MTPVLIFKTKRKMDDYDAQDMHHGDLTEDVLKNKFDLRDVSARVDPYTGTKLDPSPYSYYLPQKEVQLDKGNSARILFDEFRDLSDSFSFYGEYKGVMRRMITHMQGNTGTPFNDPLLDQALKEQILNDTSSGSSLIQIKQALADNIDADEEIYPLARKGKLTESVSLHSKLPKFDDLIDRINGLVITVHDTWSTEITLESLDIHGSSYSAQIKYKVQDHFGLDDYDISNRVFHQFRIFRIWYTLQRWENYGFRPFITEMNTTITITGEVR
nr:DUF3289 family protein [Rahnella sp. PD12R]